MATIKYLLQSKSTTAPVYLRLSLGRGKSFKRKTGYVFDPKLWSKATGFPKGKDEVNKEIKSKLKKLESFIIDKYNLDYSNGIKLDGVWLAKSLDEFHNRKAPEQLDLLINYSNSFLAKLPHRVTRNGKIGVDKDTITKYNTIVTKLTNFQNYKQKTYLVKDVDLNFRDEFIRYLTEEDNIGDNTAGRYLGFVKTIVLDARKNSIQVSPQINEFKSFSVKPPIVTLSFEEIERIKNTEIENDALSITRDWLIIGCFTGQRVSDLLRMNSNMIEEIKGFEFITLKQVKTGKLVQIPIHDEVKLILDKRKGNFPPSFSNTTDSNSTIFNRKLKLLCKKANIDDYVNGNLFDPKTKRSITKEYPKWKLVSSHICRRSFATNFYSKRRYPTPLLMNITAHSTEKMFLEYINKKPIDYSLQLAEIWSKELIN